MQRHSESYDAFKALRRVDARATIVPKAAEILSGVSITTKTPDKWETFLPDKLTDGDKAEAAVISSNHAGMDITLPQKMSPYLRISLAEGYQMAQGETVTVIICITDMDIVLNCATESGEIFVDDDLLTATQPSYVYPAGSKAYKYRLEFPQGARVSEISVMPPSELNEPIIFGSDDIISMSIQEELDPTCRSFPMRKLTLSLNNSNRAFNTFAAENFDGCAVKTEIAIDGEYINTGEFFIDSFETQKNRLTVKITAYDCVKAMERHKTGYTLSQGDSATLEQLIAWGNLAFDGLTFNIDSYTGGMPLSPYMRRQDSQRNVLKGIAQAACGRIWANRNNVINILWGSSSDGYHTLNADRIYSYDGIKDVRPADFVVVEGESGTGQYKATAGRFFIGCASETVSNNFISKGNERAVAETIFNQLSKRSEMKVKYRGDPCIEVNDSVLLLDTDGGDMAFFDVIGVTLDYNGGLSGTLKLKGGGSVGGTAAVSLMSLYGLREEDVGMTRSGVNPQFIKRGEGGETVTAPKPLYYLEGRPIEDEESYLMAGYEKTDPGAGATDPGSGYGKVINGGTFAAGKDGKMVKIQNTDRE